MPPAADRLNHGMKMDSFLFYDIETTGLNKSFDQVLQFAAIRTNASLQEIDRRTIRVRLRPDVIPSPQAMITHRISIADAMSGICELEAVQEIHALLNQPGTISLGYNSMGFDDEFLRFSFYRNLLPPYTHQYANGCSRIDLLPMAIVFYLYKPDVLNWPLIDGRPTLKLEHINAANHLAVGRAHDAMVDVMASVELARRFFREQQIWDYLLGYFDKLADRQRIEKLPVSFQTPLGSHRLGLMIGAAYGSDQQYQIPVLSIGDSIPYSNQTLWLRLDLPELKQATPETIDSTSWVIRKRYGEPPIILPPLERYWKKVSDERRQIHEENILWLQSNPEMFQEIIMFHREFSYPVIPNLDADAALYQNGFLSRQEQTLCSRFHHVSLIEKLEMIDRFSDAVTRELAVRVICRNYPEEMPDAMGEQFKAYLLRINPPQKDQALQDYKGERRMTPSGALEEIQDLQHQAGLNLDQRRLLEDLKSYLLTTFQLDAVK